MRSDGQMISGTIRGISSAHGNVYSSITPDQYAKLGLATGSQVRIDIGGHELALPVVRDYADVPVGAAMAVLHREGLTFAIRDGNFSREYGISEGMSFKFSVRRPSR
jgi:S-adenosylmethionine hydrolase